MREQKTGKKNKMLLNIKKSKYAVFDPESSPLLSNLSDLKKTRSQAGKEKEREKENERQRENRFSMSGLSNDNEEDW